MKATSRAVLLLAGIVLVAALLAAVTFFIPPVRAAFNEWLGVARAPANTVILTPVEITVVPVDTPTVSAQPPAATPTGAPHPPDPTFDPVSRDAGWSILKPAWLPEGYVLSDIYYDANNKMVTLSYLATRTLPGSDQLTETQQMTLIQALHNDQVPLQVAPSATLEEVQLGNLTGAFTKGAWDSEFVANQNETNGGHFQSTWDASLPIQNVYWQVGDIYLVLVSPDSRVSKDDLIKMAASANQ